MRVSILMGLPGAGKSTFARRTFSAEVAYVSKDDFASNGNRKRRQGTLIREAVEAGRDVVVDNTNVTIEDRAAIIAIAREMGVEVDGYVLQATVAECRTRNAEREGKKCVPLVAIYTAAKKWQTPTAEEGFNALYIVQVADGRFEVAPYNLA